MLICSDNLSCMLRYYMIDIQFFLDRIYEKEKLHLDHKEHTLMKPKRKAIQSAWFMELQNWRLKQSCKFIYDHSNARNKTRIKKRIHQYATRMYGNDLHNIYYINFPIFMLSQQMAPKKTKHSERLEFNSKRNQH